MSNFTSPLHEMVSIYQTDYWNDSCSIEELTYGIEHGAVGATTNPTIGWREKEWRVRKGNKPIVIAIKLSKRWPI